MPCASAWAQMWRSFKFGWGRASDLRLLRWAMKSEMRFVVTRHKPVTAFNLDR